MQIPSTFILIFCLCIDISRQGHIKERGLSPFELDDFFNYKFRIKNWNATWISDSAVLYSGVDNKTYTYDFATRKSEIFLSQNLREKYSMASTSVSNDLAYILIKYNETKDFRHLRSRRAQYALYDIKNKKYYDIANSLPLQLIKFAPQNHSLVYVQDNNIFYLKDYLDIQNPVKVTTAGKLGSVFNGIADWVYTEEVLHRDNALWFSPDSAHLAYAVFNDEKVPSISYPVYKQDQYPSQIEMRYPKAGANNPVVTAHVYNFESTTTVEFQLPPTISNKEPNDFIMYDLIWISNTEVVIVSTNRVQNESSLIRCSINGQCAVETSFQETEGWRDKIKPTYNKDGTKRLEILPQAEGNDRYNHLVLTNLETNTVTRLTYGKRMILSIYGWDEDSGSIYYTATVTDIPSQQHVYVTEESGKSHCLTCHIKIDGVGCAVGSAQFSTKFSYYAATCSGPSSPHLIQVVNTKNARDIFVWEDNSKLKQKLATKAEPKIKNMLVAINNQFNATVRLLLPPHLDENSKKKYPAIVKTYGGPNRNQIVDEFKIGDFLYYIVTKREYIWILIDGRGSGRDGYNKMFQIYRNLGTVEVNDQIQVTKYLQDNLPYIDSARTGIWGWSYGGFCSSWALAKDVDHTFLFALSVAPVTNFLFYDSVYTERYMGLPTANDNQAGYNNTDLSRVVESFRGRNYFIIYGTADDNVHYQNSMNFIKALEEADIDFRLNSYPDENHSMSNVWRHLHHLIDKYWAEQFGLQDSQAYLSSKLKEHKNKKTRK